MISYAQNFEDVMLNRVFGTQPRGFYIDVGAADPVNLSVTKWFYDHGWSGINIEPVPAFHEKLMRERPRDINLRCGAGATSGEARFHEYPVKEWSTFNLELRPSEDVAADAPREIVVPLRTLNEIIEENAPGREIDFLKIDVEGWEEDVLRGLDFRKYRPTVILAEAVDRENQKYAAEAIDKILDGAGYLSVYFDGLNNFYLKSERADLSKNFSTPLNVYDDFKLSREVELEKTVDMQRAEIAQAHVDLPSRMAQIETLTSMLKQSEAERSNTRMLWMALLRSTKAGRVALHVCRLLKR